MLVWLRIVLLGGCGVFLVACKDPCAELQDKICKTTATHPPEHKQELCKKTKALLALTPASSQRCVSLLASWEETGRSEVLRFHRWYQHQDEILSTASERMASSRKLEEAYVRATTPRYKQLQSDLKRAKDKLHHHTLFRLKKLLALHTKK